MRYAIAYVSTVDDALSHEEKEILMKKATDYNNSQDITGVILCSDNNFFQFLEGEKANLFPLYEKIEKDPRHYNLIKFIEKPVSNPAYDGYIFDFVTENTKFNNSKIKDYIHHIEVLDTEACQKVKGVIDTIII